MSDAEINAAVAEKVAGWTIRKTGISPTDPMAWAKPGDTKGNVTNHIPDYLHDANAVIALLDKEGYWNSAFCDNNDPNERHRVTVNPDITEYYGYADTFCRAACRALLAAHATEGGKDKP